MTSYAITGSFITATGRPAVGYVSFKPTAPIIDGDIVIEKSVSVELVNGEIPEGFELVETPEDITYRVTEQLGKVASYNIEVTAPVDLALVERLLDPAEYIPFQAKSEKGQSNGYAPLDEDGLVPNENLPAGSAAVTSVAGRSGAVTLVKADVGLGNVDNTSDTDKPVSSLTAAALAGKSDTGHTHTNLVGDIADHTAALWLPSDNGYLAWTLDTGQAGNSSLLPGAGVLYGVKIKLSRAATVNYITCRVTTEGNTMTNTYLALYDASGNRVGVSADQSTTFAVAGKYDVALASPYSAAAGTYYVGAICGSASTRPTFSRGITSAILNDGLAAGSFRGWSSGTGQTAAPASVTLSGTAAMNVNFWFALKN